MPVGALELVAAGRFTVAGGVLTSVVLRGCTAAYTALGRFTLTLEKGLDNNECVIQSMITAASGALDSQVAWNPATSTDTAKELCTDNIAGAAADPAGLNFLVWKVATGTSY